jgi:hypothetical protein
MSKLSERIRPGVEAAPWVCEEVSSLEKRLAEAEEALRKIVNCSYTEFRGYGPNDDGTVYSDRSGTEYWKGVEKAAKLLQGIAMEALKGVVESEKGGEK